jgi:hypothetical protein
MFRHATQQRLGFHLPGPDVLTHSSIQRVGTLLDMGRVIDPDNVVWDQVGDHPAVKIPLFSWLPQLDGMVEKEKQVRAAEKGWLEWIKDVAAHSLGNLHGLAQKVARVEELVAQEDTVAVEEKKRAIVAEPFAVTARGVFFANWYLFDAHTHKQTKEMLLLFSESFNIGRDHMGAGKKLSKKQVLRN